MPALWQTTFELERRDTQQVETASATRTKHQQRLIIAQSD